MKNKLLYEQLDWRISKNTQQLASVLASDIASLLSLKLSMKDRVILAVSGGSTPIPFFEKLSQYQLDWSCVDILLVDERWVDLNDEQSNEAMIRRYLLQNEANKANLIALKKSAQSPEQGLHECGQTIAKLALPIDVAILGMGEDGHTASLFPSMPNLDKALHDETALCVVARPIDSKMPRISLSASLLCAADDLVLHISGEKKRATLARACDVQNEYEMPIWSIISRKLPKVYWSP